MDRKDYIIAALHQQHADLLSKLSGLCADVQIALAEKGTKIAELEAKLKATEKPEESGEPA